ncbi:hypothetical protein EXN66_Car010072 [Channa argus]|uniref:Uncharacterized protein n=1 Tax=Channa argus TaxID=215402 RepID=A0A6G1PWP8_CHAAH|nr:hypothetical protein EXN66_Car010072 [Channa argus]
MSLYGLDHEQILSFSTRWFSITLGIISVLFHKFQPGFQICPADEGLTSLCQSCQSPFAHVLHV